MQKEWMNGSRGTIWMSDVQYCSNKGIVGKPYHVSACGKLTAVTVYKQYIYTRVGRFLREDKFFQTIFPIFSTKHC